MIDFVLKNNPFNVSIIVIAEFTPQLGFCSRHEHLPFLFDK